MYKQIPCFEKRKDISKDKSLSKKEEVHKNMKNNGLGRITKVGGLRILTMTTDWFKQLTSLSFMEKEELMQATLPNA